jgi:hypothetical protein
MLLTVVTVNVRDAGGSGNGLFGGAPRRNGEEAR